MQVENLAHGELQLSGWITGQSLPSGAYMAVWPD
jgi:hypothetical protein